MYIIIAILIAIVGLLFLLNRLMGYKKGNIIIDFDERYYKFSEHVEAIRNKLEDDGRDVDYMGNGKFRIDGRDYLFIERNVSMGGVPMQRTILKLDE
ncbi:hypothetical protein [Jeotgalibacillus haloalkalitolerans]|uniref:Uncharacterized protein n=1 Tax=Jeotgalibacillus haloalkalitolerans TaxID=3104292 RepID=A0ABU5KQJ0_9BACL|nr:hypothetical protein [Jeotgalibacillus sp. HH7-29]MDZ5713514.1 hypothetical protein [Jeotgalibacillus sp. HH7-29]